MSVDAWGVRKVSIALWLFGCGRLPLPFWIWLLGKPWKQWWYDAAQNLKTKNCLLTFEHIVFGSGYTNSKVKTRKNVTLKLSWANWSKLKWRGIWAIRSNCFKPAPLSIKELGQHILDLLDLKPWNILPKRNVKVSRWRWVAVMWSNMGWVGWIGAHAGTLVLSSYAACCNIFWRPVAKRRRKANAKQSTRKSHHGKLSNCRPQVKCCLECQTKAILWRREKKSFVSVVIDIEGGEVRIAHWVSLLQCLISRIWKGWTMVWWEWFIFLYPYES